MFGAVMIVRICGEGLQVAIKVQNYESYKARVEKQLHESNSDMGRC